MKKLIFIIIGILSTFQICVQCIANAGEDIHRCSPDSSVVIGGNPTTINGTPPYTYEWSMNPIPTGSQIVPFIYASNMLSDTSIANPSFVYTGSFLNSSMTFFLRITDDLGCQSVDTVKITTSIFNVHLMYHEYWINQGDSVYLNQTPNISGGYGIPTYDWNPSYGLSDTTLALGFWASPDSSTSYAATVTDSKGCSKTGSILYYVNVFPLSVDNILRTQIRIFPNPTTELVSIRTDGSVNIDKYVLWNSIGQKVSEIDGSLKIIDMSTYQNGIYVLKVYIDDEILVYRIVKK